MEVQIPIKIDKVIYGSRVLTLGLFFPFSEKCSRCIKLEM